MKNYINVVATGNKVYSVDRCYKNLPEFDTIKEAKKYASQFTYAKVFRVHFFADTGDLSHVSEWKR